MCSATHTGRPLSISKNRRDAQRRAEFCERVIVSAGKCSRRGEEHHYDKSSRPTGIEVRGERFSHPDPEPIGAPYSGRNPVRLANHGGTQR